jgi:hypothetical protein
MATRTRSQMEATGATYLGTMQQVNAAQKAGKKIITEGANKYIAAPAPGTTVKTQVGLGGPPGSAADIASSAISGAPKATIPSTPFTPGSTAFGLPKTTDYEGVSNRAGLEAKGAVYLGTATAVENAKKAGKELININGNIYVKPPKPASTGDQYRQEQNTNTTNNGNLPPGTVPTTGDTEKPPEPVSLVDTYNKLSKDYNIENLSSHLNSLDQNLAQYDTNYQAGLVQNKNALAPMELIQGKNRELYDQYQLGRQTLLNERNAIAAQVTAAQQTVSTMVSLTGQDYTNAKAAYDTQFSQNLQVQEYYDTKADRASSAARANLSTITSAITASGKQWNQLDPSMKANISSLEAASGLPQGTIQNFVAVKPKAELLASVNGVDKSGNDIVTLIYKDANGNPGQIKVIKTGGYTAPKSSSSSSSSGGGQITPQIASDYVSNIIQGRLTLKDVPQDQRSSISTVYNSFLATPVGKNISSYIASLQNGKDSWNGIDNREKLIDNIMKTEKNASRAQIENTVYTYIPDDFETGLKASNESRKSSADQFTQQITNAVKKATG